MSDRKVPCLACAAVLMLALPVQASAQRSDASVAAARARLDSLIPQYEAARVAMEHADSIARARRVEASRIPLDSAVVGPFMIIYRPKDEKRVLKLFRSVWSEHADMLAGMETKDTRVTLLVQTGKVLSYYAELSRLPGHHAVWIPAGPSSVHTRRLVMNGLYDAVAPDLPDSVRAWISIQGNDRPLSRGTDRETVYRELATAPSHVAHKCFQRDAVACTDALGLNRTVANEAWYTLDQLRHFVVLRNGGLSAYDRSRCINESDRAACIAVLRPYGLPPAPISADGRASLVVFALEKGGTGSFARMQRAGGNVRNALESAAGTGVDKLVADWRTAIEQSRPMVYAGSGKMRIAALFWIVLLSALAMRSTRQRIE